MFVDESHDVLDALSDDDVDEHDDTRALRHILLEQQHRHGEQRGEKRRNEDSRSHQQIGAFLAERESPDEHQNHDRQQHHQRVHLAQRIDQKPAHRSRNRVSRVEDGHEVGALRLHVPPVEIAQVDGAPVHRDVLGARDAALRDADEDHQRVLERRQDGERSVSLLLLLAQRLLLGQEQHRHHPDAQQNQHGHEHTSVIQPDHAAKPACERGTDRGAESIEAVQNVHHHRLMRLKQHRCPSVRTDIDEHTAATADNQKTKKSPDVHEHNGTHHCNDKHRKTDDQRLLDAETNDKITHKQGKNNVANRRTKNKETLVVVF